MLFFLFFSQNTTAQVGQYRLYKIEPLIKNTFGVISFKVDKVEVSSSTWDKSCAEHVKKLLEKHPSNERQYIYLDWMCEHRTGRIIQHPPKALFNGRVPKGRDWDEYEVFPRSGRVDNDCFQNEGLKHGINCAKNVNVSDFSGCYAQLIKKEEEELKYKFFAGYPQGSYHEHNCFNRDTKLIISSKKNEDDVFEECLQVAKKLYRNKKYHCGENTQGTSKVWFFTEDDNGNKSHGIFFTEDDDQEISHKIDMD